MSASTSDSTKTIRSSELAGSRITPRTLTGEVTASIFGLNRPERILERIALIEAGRYPSDKAQRLLERGLARE